jgi:hypothetical protein
MIKIQNINDGQQMIDAKQWQNLTRPVCDRERSKYTYITLYQFSS